MGKTLLEYLCLLFNFITYYKENVNIYFQFCKRKWWYNQLKTYFLTLKELIIMNFLD